MSAWDDTIEQLEHEIEVLESERKKHIEDIHGLARENQALQSENEQLKSDLQEIANYNKELSEAIAFIKDNLERNPHYCNWSRHDYIEMLWAETRFDIKTIICAMQSIKLNESEDSENE